MTLLPSFAPFDESGAQQSASSLGASASYLSDTTQRMPHLNLNPPAAAPVGEGEGRDEEDADGEGRLHMDHMGVLPEGAEDDEEGLGLGLGGAEDSGVPSPRRHHPPFPAALDSGSGGAAAAVLGDGMGMEEDVDATRPLSPPLPAVGTVPLHQQHAQQRLAPDIVEVIFGESQQQRRQQQQGRGRGPRKSRSVLGNWQEGFQEEEAKFSSSPFKGAGQGQPGEEDELLRRLRAVLETHGAFPERYRLVGGEGERLGLGLRSYCGHTTRPIYNRRPPPTPTSPHTISPGR